MSKNVVLIDLDHTLVDENYQLTDETVKEVIAERRREGWIVGLNANAPLRTQLNRWNQLGMNGPIVVERGAAVWFPDEAFVELCRSKNIVQKAKEAILGHIQELDETLLIHGDATGFLRNIHEVPGVSNSRLVAINGLRLFSIAFHVRRIEKETGRLHVDVDLAEKVIEELRKYFPITDTLSEGQLETDYGFFHIDPIDVSKATGATKAFNDIHASRRVVIGDHIEDYVEDAEVYAVANASQDLKNKADKVSVASYASGVKEILASL